MQIVTDSSGKILQYGENMGSGITLSDAQRTQLLSLLGSPRIGLKLNADGSITSVSGETPSVEAPDIKAIITALVSSQSLDQSTKNALIAALQGQ